MTKEQAYREGRKLLKRLRGRGWKLRVWYSGGSGWYFDVANGAICVYPSYDALGRATYWSLMTEDPQRLQGCGFPYWVLGRDSQATHYRDPNKLVRQQVLTAERHVRKLQKVVTATKKACGL